jgi:putative transposase
MDKLESLSHSKWACKYHIVFIPKYRKKVLFGQLRQRLGPVLHDLAARKECRIEAGHMRPDHVHMLLSVPPKYSVSQAVGFIKGKSAIWIAQNIDRKVRNIVGSNFWARGYFVSTVGRDEELIRRYIRDQEIADKQFDQQHKLF